MQDAESFRRRSRFYPADHSTQTPPAQLDDDWGRSTSPRSSSNVTRHGRDASASNSLVTRTNPSSHSDDARSQQSLDVEQQLCVLEPDSEDLQPVPSFTLNLSAVKRHSVVLFHHLQRDRRHGQYYSTISASNPLALPVSASMLRLFVRHIDQPPPAPNARAHGEAQWDFPKFLELSTLLWAYRCSIDQWVPIADVMKSQFWDHDWRNLTPDRLVPWIFCGLLYNWADVFEEASLELVSRYSAFQAELHGARFIPMALRNELDLRRQDYVQKTFLFVREKWRLLLDPTEARQPPLLGRIYEDLRDRWNIDLQHDLPPDKYQSVSPDKLLRQVEATATELHSQRDPVILPARRTDTPPRPPRREDSRREQQALNPLADTNRDSEAAKALSHLVTITTNRLKRRKNFRHNPVPPEDGQVAIQRLNRLCDQMLEDCRHFREQKLKPLSLDDLADLRHAQLLISHP